MKTRTVLVFTFICCPLTFAQQIDSLRLEFFPLHKGDLWQYFYGNSTGQGYLKNSEVVTADTVLSNGLHYAMLTGSPYYNYTKFYRIDSLLRIQEYYSFIGDSCGGAMNEANVFRLYERDSTIWKICYNIANQLIGEPYYFRYNGIFLTSAFDSTREVMVFQAGGTTTSADTTFWDVSPDYLLMRGIGIYLAEKGEGSYAQLVGAIINGVKYGTIHTSVKEHENLVRYFILQQNYPNPFNGSTLIRYSISQREYVQLSVFDILGREVSVLVNKPQDAGTYTAVFRSINQSSGVYFYRLIAGDRSQTKSMIIQK
jgi:hypothetical protein